MQMMEEAVNQKLIQSILLYDMFSYMLYLLVKTEIFFLKSVP